MSLVSFRGHPAYPRKMIYVSRKNGEVTELDRRIVSMLAEGFGVHQIADATGNTYHTIETYKIRLCRLFKVKNACALVAYFIRNKLIE